jgi:hypothetical protein
MNVAICAIIVIGFQFYFGSIAYETVFTKADDTCLKDNNTLITGVGECTDTGVRQGTTGALETEKANHVSAGHTVPSNSSLMEQTLVQDEDAKNNKDVSSVDYVRGNNSSAVSDVNSTQMSDTNQTLVDPTSGTKLVPFNDTPATPIIIFWSSHSSQKSSLITCPTCTCKITYNLTYLSIADAVVFNVFYLRNDTIPRHAHSRQVFVFLDYESQSRTNYFTRFSPFAFLNDYYNVTMTFKGDPDTDIHTPYGKYVDQVQNISDPVPTAASLKDKTEFVAWIMSNCNAPSSRMDYYRELSKHISIHIYGACGNRTCPRSNLCYKNISSNYRFYLAFENSFCLDYASEKVSYLCL